jgi:hypothetical protein
MNGTHSKLWGTKTKRTIGSARFARTMRRDADSEKGCAMIESESKAEESVCGEPTASCGPPIVFS